MIVVSVSSPSCSLLPVYGFFGFLLSRDAPEPGCHEERLPAREIPVLALVDVWRTFFELKAGAREMRRLMSSRTRDQLQHEVLLCWASRD